MAGGDHGVSVFFRCVLLVVLCVVHEVTVLVKKFKKFESTIVEYSLVLWFCTVGLMGLKQTFIRRV